MLTKPPSEKAFLLSGGAYLPETEKHREQYENLDLSFDTLVAIARGDAHGVPA